MNKTNKNSYEALLKVPFHDLDPAQIVWHGNYFKYFDIARAGLFDSLGLDLYSFGKRTKYIFPIIRTSTKHIFPLKHRDEFICKASIVDVNIKIIIDFEIRLAPDGKVCARSRSEQVTVKAPKMDLLLRVPEEIRDVLLKQQ